MAPVEPDDPAQTVVDGVPEGASTPDRSFTIAVATGPDKGTRVVLDPAERPRILVGQSEVCELRLSDRQVSRRHAAIENVGNALRITDLGSTNGTLVDRVRVVEALLVGGEIVRVGATQLRVEEGPAAAAPALAPAHGFGRVVGESREMRRLYPLLERLAHADIPVVLEGETGTGKEALAESIHEQGPRAAGPFVIFDCTAVPPSLVEAELFGHERGAFTGAVGARPGVFEQASGGTLFIDEIGDLDLPLQSKLLRAVERSEVRRIGSASWTRVDVRILAATRRDLDREVEAGHFRDDLFHRLTVARIELPPLRHRRGDVAVLARHFWRQLGGDPATIPPALLRQWEAYAWPGNIRELRNAVARHLAVGDLAQRMAQDPPGAEHDTPRPYDAVDALVASGLPFPRARDRMLDLFTERYVAHVLEQHGGSIAEAAAASGIGRRYFEKLRARRSGR